MKYYIKTFCDIYEDEQNPLTLVWYKGEYYEIYGETENYIYCNNEYLRKLNIKDTNPDEFYQKVWNALRGIKKIKGRLPLNFIKLSEEEVNSEKERNNVREN